MMKSKFLTIIHDNMNTRKSCILRLSTPTKAIANVGQIPMSLIGILIHGHGDGTYAHYGTTLWPSDSNYFISSLCCVLKVLKKTSWMTLIIPKSPNYAIFNALLHSKSQCLESLVTTSGTHSSIKNTSIAQKLRGLVGCQKCHSWIKKIICIDDTTKGNKSQCLMVFGFVLTTRHILKEMVMEFLIVGHTHKDIDVYFGKLSERPHWTNIYILADLMEAFMDS